MAILESSALTVGCLLSQALWTELISCLRLSRGGVDGLPEPLLLLLPPPPKGGWSVPMPLSTESEWLRRWDYPPVRRAQRLSFLMESQAPLPPPARRRARSWTTAWRTRGIAYRANGAPAQTTA